MPRRARAPLPLATAGLVAVILATYAVERAGDGLGLCGANGLVPARPSALAALTSMFLHDPSTWAHVGGNAVSLAVAGAAVERLLGPLKLLALFLVAGVVGALTHVLVDPSSTAPLVGASGGICGLFAALALLRPSAVGFVGSFVAFNIASLLLGTGGSVSMGGHVGGFVAGTAMMATVFAGRLASVRGWRRAPRVARAAAAG